MRYRFLRPAKEGIYLTMAKELAHRSTCNRAHVACIITDTNAIIVGAGYNGSPPGSPHCINEGCIVVDEHCVRTIHAEMNAIVRINTTEKELIGYCTHTPCFNCLKVGLTKGIYTWWYLQHYADKARDKFVEWYNTCHDKKIELREGTCDKVFI